MLDHEQEQEPSWLPLLNSGQVLDLPTPFKNRGEPQQDLVVHFLNRPDQRLLWLQQWGAFLLISAAILLVISGQRIQLGLRDRSNQLRQRQQQRQQQQQQRHSQRRDPLTGQLSEQGLLEGMAEQQRRYPGFHQAVLVVDLDRFSLINSALGRSQADQLLVQMGEQLVKQLPASSLVARLEADRFAAALLSTSDRSLSSEITAISAAMSRFELSLASQPILLTAHCGAMHLTAHQSSLANAVEQAGYSCDQAKRNQTRLVVHAPQPGAEDPFTNLQNLHQELNRALRRGSVIAYGQPAWRHSPQGWQPAYVELLCRLVDPEGGKHYWREEFAQAAQFWGTATSFDQHMLDNMGQAVEALQQHGGGLPADLTVAVNITPGSLAQPGFDQQIAELIELYGLPAEQLCLEITEQAAIADLSNTRQLLTRLKRLGVKVALDDFGAGMTSLSQLQELPLDFVKVDRRFVMHLLMPTTSASHRCSEAVVRFLVELGRELGFEVIAEGVEQASLIAPLQAMGVDLLQGYLFGQPAPLRSLDLQAPLQLPTSEPTQVA